MSEERAAFSVAVFVIIRNEAGEMLLQQRAGTNFLPGYYDFPSGHVEVSESLQMAAARELTEETTLTVEPSDLSLVHVNQNTLDQGYVNFVFEAKVWGGTPEIGEPDRCSDMQFFSPGKLPKKCSLSVRLMEQRGFKSNLTPSFVDLEAYQSIMGESFSSG